MTEVLALSPMATPVSYIDRSVPKQLDAVHVALGDLDAQPETPIDGDDTASVDVVPGDDHGDHVALDDDDYASENSEGMSVDHSEPDVDAGALKMQVADAALGNTSDIRVYHDPHGVYLLPADDGELSR